MNRHPHDFTFDDQTNAVETMPDREHPIFEDENLRLAALYYDRESGYMRHLFVDCEPREMAFGNSTTSPIGVGILRGYYFTDIDAMEKAHAQVSSQTI